MIISKLLRELDGLVIYQVIVLLCYGCVGVILESKGLKLIRLSAKYNGFYQTSYTVTCLLKKVTVTVTCSIVTCLLKNTDDLYHGMDLGRLERSLISKWHLTLL